METTVRSFQEQNGDTTSRRSRTYLQKVLSQQSSMSHERIMGNLLTMFAAGSETTGNTTMICLWKMVQENEKEIYVKMCFLCSILGALSGNF